MLSTLASTARRFFSRRRHARRRMRVDVWFLVLSGIGAVIDPAAAEEGLPQTPAVQSAKYLSDASTSPPVEQPPAEPPQLEQPPSVGDVDEGATTSPEQLAPPSIEAIPLPAPTGPSALTVDQAINACLVADPKLRAGFQAISQANADALSASLKPNPQLFADVQLLPLTRPFTVTRQGGPPQQDVNLAYPIDWFLFGKRAAQMASAARGVEVSQAEYADLVRRRVAETAIAFYDVVEAAALVTVARQNVDNLAQVEALTRKAVDAGGRPKIDLSRIRLDLLQSNQVLRDAELALTTAKARLLALMGRGEGGSDLVVSDALNIPKATEDLATEDALALALANRPDLRALRRRVSQANIDMDVERRKAFPTVTPQIGYTRQYQERAIGFPDADSWGAGLGMSIPLSDRNQGNRTKAASIAAQRRWELQLGETELRAEVASAVGEFATARANAGAVAEEELQLAAEVRDSINTAYGAGGLPLIDVLDAQRNYKETFRAFITTRANYWRAYYKLNAAVGVQIVPRD